MFGVGQTRIWSERWTDAFEIKGKRHTPLYANLDDFRLQKVKLLWNWNAPDILSLCYLLFFCGYQSNCFFYLKVKKTASTSFLSIVTLALLAKQHFWSAVLESLHVHRLVDLVVFIIHSRVKLTTDSHENKDYVTIRINEWTIQ